MFSSLSKTFSLTFLQGFCELKTQMAFTKGTFTNNLNAYLFSSTQKAEREKEKFIFHLQVHL